MVTEHNIKVSWLRGVHVITCTWQVTWPSQCMYRVPSYPSFQTGPLNWLRPPRELTTCDENWKSWSQIPHCTRNQNAGHRCTSYVLYTQKQQRSSHWPSHWQSHLLPPSSARLSNNTVAGPTSCIPMAWSLGMMTMPKKGWRSFGSWRRIVMRNRSDSRLVNWFDFVPMDGACGISLMPWRLFYFLRGEIFGSFFHVLSFFQDNGEIALFSGFLSIRVYFLNGIPLFACRAFWNAMKLFLFFHSIHSW